MPTNKKFKKAPSLQNMKEFNRIKKGELFSWVLFGKHKPNYLISKSSEKDFQGAWPRGYILSDQEGKDLNPRDGFLQTELFFFLKLFPVRKFGIF